VAAAGAGRSAAAGGAQLEGRRALTEKLGTAALDFRGCAHNSRIANPAVRINPPRSNALSAEDPRSLELTMTVTAELAPTRLWHISLRASQRCADGECHASLLRPDIVASHRMHIAHAMTLPLRVTPTASQSLCTPAQGIEAMPAAGRPWPARGEYRSPWPGWPSLSYGHTCVRLPIFASCERIRGL
jgi:hypothetical protein